MKRIVNRNTWTWSLGALSCISLMLGQLPAWAFGPPQSQQPDSSLQSVLPITDVVLDASGRLVGQIVDQQGNPRDGLVVVLRQGRREVARTVTDSEGRFALSNIPVGLYQLDAGSTRAIYRVWTTQTAPPRSHHQAVLVAETETVVRGNHIEAAVDQLDAITLAMVSSSIAAVTIAGVTLDKVNDLEDKVNALSGGGGTPASP